MQAEEQRRLFTEYAEISRRWVSTMDAKAAFLSALNGALIAFIWIGAKLPTSAPAITQLLPVTATLVALLALVLALWVIAPRQSLKSIFGGSATWSEQYKPFSFYAFIATQYRPADFEKLESEISSLHEGALAREALEQHFTISHAVFNKSLWVTRSSWLSILAILLTAFALLAR